MTRSGSSSFAVELHLDRTEFQDQLKPCNNFVSPRSPGPVSERDAEMRAGVEAVETYLEQHHKGSWHSTLKNHAVTRPKVDGGPLVHSLTKCKPLLTSSQALPARLGGAPWT